MPIYLKEADVAEFLDMPSAIAALREAFAAQARGEAVIVARTRWEFGDRFFHAGAAFPADATLALGYEF